MLTAANIQIVAAYEELGIKDPAIIAEKLDFDIVSVKATLMQFSVMYRKDIKTEPSLDFVGEEQLAAKSVIVSIMNNSDDDYLRLRAARYVRDDAKGRLDVNDMKGLNVNVNFFNVRLEQAQKAIQRAKEQHKLPAPKPTSLVNELEKDVIEV